MYPFEAGVALHWLAAPGHFANAHKAEKDRARIWMNVAAHQR